MAIGRRFRAMGATLAVAAMLAMAHGPSAQALPKKSSTDAKVIELDDDDGSGRTEAFDPPGPPTRADAEAKHLFDAGKWTEASRALSAITHGDTSGNREMAQFELAVALYNLKLYEPSYGIFAEISTRPDHPKYKETLLWLARLATQLPEPANVVERIGSYDSEHVQTFGNAQQKPLIWQLAYLMGRYKYRNRQFDVAAELFAKVDKESPFFPEAKLLSGMAYIQMRKSVPAIEAFRQAEHAADALGSSGEALRDLARLSIARTYYSAAVHETGAGAVDVDARKLGHAMDMWEGISLESPYGLDALYETSWGYYMAGDYSHVLGNLHTLSSPYFNGSFHPGASVLEALVYVSLCNTDDAKAVAARARLRLEPSKRALKGVLAGYAGEDSEEQLYGLLTRVRGANASGSPAKQEKDAMPILRELLGGRELSQHIVYVDELERERRSFKATPLLVDTPLGNDILDAIELGREIEVRNAGQLVKQRIERALGDLEANVSDLKRIEAANPSDAAAMTNRPTTDGRVIDDPTVERWPFDGEYWKDELGSYRQVTVSKCSKTHQ